MEFERDDEYTPYDKDGDDWEMPEPEPDEDDEDAELISCPKCGCDIYEEAEQCPLCGEFILRDHSTPWWIGRTTGYILLGLLGIVATIVALMAL